MLYVLWSILNIGLFIYFVFLCIKAIKYIRNAHGLGNAIFFLCALFLPTIFSVFRIQSPDKSSTQDEKSFFFTDEKMIIPNSTRSTKASLYKTPISRYDLAIILGANKSTNEIVPVLSYVRSVGFLGGTIWKTRNISVNRKREIDSFKYTVEGAIEWQFWGIPLWSEKKYFEGSVKVP